MRLGQRDGVRAITLILVGGLFLAGGCTKTYHVRVSRYDLGESRQVSSAPLTGVYSVKWTRTLGKNLRNIDGTQTLLYRGEQLGFEAQDDGTIVAVAGGRRIIMDNVPDEARMLVWYHKSKRQTQFGKEMGKAMDVALTTTAVGVGVAGIGAGVGAASYIDAKYGDKRDDRWDE